MPRSSLLVGVVLTLSVATACSASKNQAGADGVGENGGNGQGASGGSGQGGDGIGGFSPIGGSGGGSTNPNPTCVNQASVDDDGDGFTEEQGDCNDCDKNVNPGAVEVINLEPDDMGNVPPVADEDCDTFADNVMTCDEGIALENQDPFMAAQAIDLCQKATPADKKWGVLEAKWVRANGTGAPNPLQYGIKAGFGQNVKPQLGKSLLAISAGHARDAGDPDGCGSTTCTIAGPTNAPPGFPQDVPGCEGDTAINDDVALDLKLRAPTNATGYSFNFKFYSFEFPEWVCTAYNDQFIALVTPPPQGSINGNISFDSNTNPVSVNIAFFDVCDPASASQWAQQCFPFFGSCPPLPSPYCPSGINELVGTGFLEWDTFSYAGGTSWLKTQAPISPGQEFSIRFAIWDTSDQALDSTAIIDNFQWIANGGTVAVGTVPEPEPK